METKPKCPSCNNKHTVKNGHTRTGSQRHLCKNCGYRFTNNTNLRKMDYYFTTQAVHLWLEGLSYKLISEIIGIAPEIISKYIKPFKEILAPIRKDLISIENLKVTRKNNLFIGFHKKKINLPIYGSGIILIGHEVEIWGVSRII